MFPKVQWITNEFIKWMEEQNAKREGYGIILGAYISYDNMIELNPVLAGNQKEYLVTFIHEVAHWIFNFLPWKMERKLDKLLDKYF